MISYFAMSALLCGLRRSIACLMPAIFMSGVFMGGMSSLSLAQTGPVPANAHEKSYGGGWECNDGYRLDNGACLKIQIPDHAYAIQSSYGPGWECNYGYRESKGQCAKIRVPANGFLDSSGERWECERVIERPATPAKRSTSPNTVIWSTRPMAADGNANTGIVNPVIPALRSSCQRMAIWRNDQMARAGCVIAVLGQPGTIAFPLSCQRMPIWIILETDGTVTVPIARTGIFAVCNRDDQ
jgi:hypothetical protein